MAGIAPTIEAALLPESDRAIVFISYSRDDLAFADHLDVALDLAGFETILDRHGIHGAEDWEEKLGALIKDADTILFVLSPSSAASDACAWEVRRATALNKRIIPVVAQPLGAVAVPPALAKLNYIYFYPEPKKPGSGVKSGSAELIKALKLDLKWMRMHTRYLQRAIEWQDGGRNPHRLLSGNEDINAAKNWIAERPKDAPAPTELHVEFIRASELEEARLQSEELQRLADMAAAQASREAALAGREEALKREASERAARELAQLAATEAAEREAATAKRVVRRTYVGLAVALVLAAVAGVFGHLARQQRLVAEQQALAATAAATRAKLAEEQARADQKRAQSKEFEAIINECTASEALMKSRPESPKHLYEYLGCGVRLGYALVRQEEVDDARDYLKRLTEVATDAAPGKDDATRRFYVLLVTQAAAVAECAAATPGTPARVDAVSRLIAAADEVLAYQPPTSIAESWRGGLEGRWREEVARGLFYVSKFLRENSDHRLAHDYSSRIIDRMKVLPVTDEMSGRVLARALGDHAWTALLSRRPDEAVRSAERAIELVARFNIPDLEFVRRNHAHALAFDGRSREAAEAYRKLNPSGLAADAEELDAAGLCNALLNEVLGRSKPCVIAGQ